MNAPEPPKASPRTFPCGFCLPESGSLLELKLDGEIVGILHTYNDSLADVVQSDKTEILYGRDYFYEELLGLRFRISPFAPRPWADPVQLNLARYRDHCSDACPCGRAGCGGRDCGETRGRGRAGEEKWVRLEKYPS